MILNITASTVLGFFLFGAGAYLFMRGGPRIRMIAWLAIWQFFSPVRDGWVDFYLLFLGWAILEILYKRLTRPWLKTQ